MTDLLFAASTTPAEVSVVQGILTILLASPIVFYIVRRISLRRESRVDITGSMLKLANGQLVISAQYQKDMDRRVKSLERRQRQQDEEIIGLKDLVRDLANHNDDWESWYFSAQPSYDKVRYPRPRPFKSS